MKQRITALFLCLCMFCGYGCATVQQYATPDNTRSATALVCSNALTYAVSDADRAHVANYIYSVATGIRSLTGGKVPTPDQLRATINLFSPGNGEKWATLGTALGAVYGGIYAQIKGDPKIALSYLEAMAAGCEDAAKAFLPSPDGTPAPGR